MRRAEHAVLAAVLLGAAALRFAGLDQDLRRGSPTPDEWSNFIGPVAQMWELPTADPRVHGGYPGLFNWLAFLPMGLGSRLGGETGACLAARALVAACSTLNVLLLFLVVRRSWGGAAALLAAALLAVSRSEVSEAHFITPDVLVVTALLALLLTAGARPIGAWPGVWAGLGTAVKYSGVLLFAAAVAELAARRRLKRLWLAAAAGALAFAAAAPFALLGRGEQRRGIDELVGYYFGPLAAGRSPVGGLAGQLGEAASWLWTNLGPVAAALVLAAALARPRRPLAAPAAVLAASLAVLSLAGQVYPRHVLLASTAATILAAAGFAALARPLPAWGAVALAAAAVAVPASRGVAVARGYTRPTELDRAAEWIEARPAPPRAATSLERLRLRGVELRTGLPLWEWPPEALAHYDLLVAPRAVADRLAGLERVQAFENAGHPGGAVLVLRARRAPEPPWPPPARSSATAPGSDRAWDEDAATAWMAPAGAGWIEAEWTRPLALHALEVTVPGGPGFWPQRLLLRARVEGGAWRPLGPRPIRPARAALQRPPHGQVFLLDTPVLADGLRIERRDGREWGLSEIRMYGPPGAGR